MTKEEIRTRVVDILNYALARSPTSKIEDESNLFDDLDMDSLDVVELAMEIEDEFDTTIPDVDIDKIKTVKDIIDYIEKQQGDE